MAVFYFRDAYGVVRPSDTSETFYVRDCYGVAFPSTALPIYIRDAYGNIVLSNAVPLYVHDATGQVVDSSVTAPTVIDAYGNRVVTSTGVIVWQGGAFPSSGVSAPSITTAPSISGTATVGEILTTTDGVWTGSPTSYTYVWKRNGIVIPNEIYNTCMVPPIAATETITCTVTASNLGGSASSTSPATSTIARAYVASAFATPIGAWSHCMGIVSAYAGPALCDIVMDGVTKTCNMNSKGLLDFTGDIIPWWQARTSYTGYGGVMPRVSKIYTQGTTTTAHFLQATYEYMPIMDLNNIKPDGTIPLAFNSFSGRGTYWDEVAGAMVTISAGNKEQNCYMQMATSTIVVKAADHTLAMVVEGATNLGNNTGQKYLAGMKAITSASNWGLRTGNNSWSTKYGLGVTSGTTIESPATALRVPNTRCLVAEMQTTLAANPIDGVTASGSNAVVNIRVNNNTGNQWTANTIARSASNVSSGFFSLGRGPSGTSGGNDGSCFAFYGAVLVNDPISTGSAPVVDNRTASYASLMKCLNVRDDDTTVITVFGASSAASYAGASGGGFATRLRDILGPKVSTQAFAAAGARIGTDMVPSKTALAGQYVPSKRNIAVLYSCAPDIGQDATGTVVGNDVLVSAGTLAQELMSSGNWYKVFICTFVSPEFAAATNPNGAVYCRTEVANFNTAVMNASNMTTYGYTGIDVVTGLGAAASDYANAQYNDTASGHGRTEITHLMIADIIAAAVAPHVA